MNKTRTQQSTSNNQFDSWPLVNLTQRNIFNILLTKPSSVSDIAAELSMSQRVITQHLSVLISAGLVQDKGRGKLRIYSIDRNALEALARQSARQFDQMLRQLDSTAYLSTHVDGDRIDELINQWDMPWPKHDMVCIGILERIHLLSRILDKLSTRAAARFNLKYIEVRLLAALDRIGPPSESTLTDLSKYTLLSMSGLAQQAESAEKKGLIARRPNAHDKRSDLLCLTEEGRKVLHKIMAHERDNEFAPIFKLPINERLLVKQILLEQLRNLRNAINS